MAMALGPPFWQATSSGSGPGGAWLSAVTGDGVEDASFVTLKSPRFVGALKLAPSATPVLSKAEEDAALADFACVPDQPARPTSRTRPAREACVGAAAFTPQQLPGLICRVGPPGSSAAAGPAARASAAPPQAPPEALSRLKADSPDTLSLSCATRAALSKPRPPAAAKASPPSLAVARPARSPTPDATGPRSPVVSPAALAEARAAAARALSPRGSPRDGRSTPLSAPTSPRHCAADAASAAKATPPTPLSSASTSASSSPSDDAAFSPNPYVSPLARRSSPLPSGVDFSLTSLSDALWAPRAADDLVLDIVASPARARGRTPPPGFGARPSFSARATHAWEVDPLGAIRTRSLQLGESGEPEAVTGSTPPLSPRCNDLV